MFQSGEPFACGMVSPYLCDPVVRLLENESAAKGNSITTGIKEMEHFLVQKGKSCLVLMTKSHNLISPASIVLESGLSCIQHPTLEGC